LLVAGTLSSFHDVGKSSCEELLKVFSIEVWASEERVNRGFDFYPTGIVVTNVISLVDSLGNKRGVIVLVSQ
jgi:hypothetical protein